MKTRGMRLLVVMGCILSSVLCTAETWYVDDDGKADFNSIQDAIDVATDGDIVFVRSGTYNEAINFLGKLITVEGEDRESTIIDGKGIDAPVVTFDSGESFFSVLSTLTIQHGSGAYWADPVFGNQKCGGGICVYGGGATGGPCSPTISDCEFIGNVVNGDGGGIAAAYDAHPKITDCHFKDNTAGRSGGGLAAVGDENYWYPSEPDVEYCLFESNDAIEEGGGIHVRWSNPLFNHVEVRDNVALNTGGAINFFVSEDARLLNSQVCGNSVEQIEGVYSDGGGNSINDSCGTCDGDVNGDGIVDVSDLLEVVGTWGVCDNCPSDIDESGVVDVTDLLIVVGNWGECN